MDEYTREYLTDVIQTIHSFEDTKTIKTDTSEYACKYDELVRFKPYDGSNCGSCPYNFTTIDEVDDPNFYYTCNRYSVTSIGLL